MKVRICNKCKGFNYKELMNQLNLKYKNIEYEIGCNNMCGIGRSKTVLIVDDRTLVADSIKDMINKIEELKK